MSGLFHRGSINFAGLLPETSSRNKDLLLEVEHLSSWPVASAIGERSFKITGVIEFVEEDIFHQYGNPIRIVRDGDSKLDEAAVREFIESNSISWRIISACNQR